MYFSSGDNGDETSTYGSATHGLARLEPVGDGRWRHEPRRRAPTNTRALETGWGTSTYNCNTTTLVCTRAGWLYGAGGGVSQVFAKPDYQAALHGKWPRRAGRRGARRSADRPARRADADLPGRRPLRRVPHRRDESVEPDLCRPDGACRPGWPARRTALRIPLFYANPVRSTTSVSEDCRGAAELQQWRRRLRRHVDLLRTFDDYSGSPTQHTGPGWDNVTGLGTPNGIFTSP